MMSESGLADLLEALYAAVEAPDEQWLRGVIARVRPGLDQGMGVHGYFVDLSPAVGFEGSDLVSTGGDEEVLRPSFDRWKALTPLPYKRALHQFAPFCTHSAFAASGFERGEIQASREVAGFPDAFGLNGLDASGRGCVVIAPSAEPIPAPDAAQVALWGRVAVHLATAARLRRHLATARKTAVEAAEAVLAPDGTWVHASGEARTSLAREALREAARRIDRARTRATRNDAEAVTTMWQAPVQRR
jgi:hypothetical protein